MRRTAYCHRQEVAGGHSGHYLFSTNDYVVLHTGFAGGLMLGEYSSCLKDLQVPGVPGIVEGFGSILPGD